MKFTHHDLFRIATFAVFALWTFGLSVSVGYAAAMFNISYRMAAGEPVVAGDIMRNAATIMATAWVTVYTLGMYLLFKIALTSETVQPLEPTVKEIIRISPGHTQLRSIPATEHQISEVCNRIFWGGHSASPTMNCAGLFATRGAFVVFRNYLLKENVLEWVNPNSHQQGIIITERGAVWFAERADKARAIPSPTAGERR